MAQILSTARLSLRGIETRDAAFILQLLNSQPFRENIGDRKLRSLDDAQQYITHHLQASYRQHGFGLWGVEDAVTGRLLGLCGILKRDTLDDPDVGYALLPQAFGQGFATEAAGACLRHAKESLGLQRICAIVAPRNQASIHVLEKIGLRFQRDIPGTESGETLRLFA